MNWTEVSILSLTLLELAIWRILTLDELGRHNACYDIVSEIDVFQRQIFLFKYCFIIYYPNSYSWSVVLVLSSS